MEKSAGANLNIDDINALQPHAPSLHRGLQVSHNGRGDQILVLDDVLDGVECDDGSDNSLRTVDQFVLCRAGVLVAEVASERLVATERTIVFSVNGPGEGR